MSQNHQITNLQKLLSESGFVDSSPIVTSYAEIPAGVTIMNNQYALVMYSSIADSEQGIKNVLRSTLEKLHSSFRDVLIALENKKGLIVDGYLLLVLKEEPSDDVKDYIQEIEQNTKVCRKHVLWPSESGNNLERSQYVTILSLPKPLNEASNTESKFSISKRGNMYLTEYRNLGNLDRLLDSIKSGAFKDAD